MQCQPFERLLGYSQLRHLDITCYFMDDDIDPFLPSWCTQLTQLESLRLHAIHGLLEFPVCLLQLRQLSSLDLLENAMFCIEFPSEMVQFSEFTALTNLDMRLLHRTQHHLKWKSTALSQLQSLESLWRRGVLPYLT